MDTKVAFVIISCFALAYAGLVPLSSARILEGPSTRTKVVGPDGSVIDAYAPGGKIILEGNAGPLIQAAPVVLAQAAIAEPQIYSHLVDEVAFSQPVGNSVETSASSDGFSVQDPKIASVSEDEQRVLLDPGTALRVETRESAPVSVVTDENPEVTTNSPSTTELVGTTDKDLSGAYIPDNFEQLFDDGSYRAEHH